MHIQVEVAANVRR